MQVNDIASAMLFSCLLVAASAWDIRKCIIPNSVCVLIGMTGLLTITPSKMLGVLLGFPLLIAALVKEGGMGGGDVKFVAACGIVLGLPVGIAGLVIGLSAALVWYVASNTMRRLKQATVMAAKASVLPLAPFLSFGFAMAYML